jgi:hypothetical protein
MRKRISQFCVSDRAAAWIFVFSAIVMGSIAKDYFQIIASIVVGGIALLVAAGIWNPLWLRVFLPPLRFLAKPLMWILGILNGVVERRPILVALFFGATALVEGYFAFFDGGSLSSRLPSFFFGLWFAAIARQEFIRTRVKPKEKDPVS